MTKCVACKRRQNLVRFIQNQLKELQKENKRLEETIQYLKQTNTDLAEDNLRLQNLVEYGGVIDS